MLHPKKLSHGDAMYKEVATNKVFATDPFAFKADTAKADFIRIEASDWHKPELRMAQDMGMTANNAPNPIG